MELGAITDTLGVAAGASAPKSPSFPIQFVEATEFKKDETNCTLEDFVLNLQENMATLVFNEPVDLSSLDLSGITFSGDSLVSVSVYPIDAPSELQCSGFTPDFSSPKLLNWTLDEDSGILGLKFDEPAFLGFTSFNVSSGTIIFQLSEPANLNFFNASARSGPCATSNLRTRL
eukprot:m.98657 g.98657  ORF g.98657 m.98657 type:complete len:174 (+) comp16758_c0_seq1:1660-2181(+)